jgi:hypothetical protein
MKPLAGVALAAAVCAVHAGNPLVSNLGMADPHLRRAAGDEGGFLLFCTHDFSSSNTGFLMKDWQLWSSPDLVDWNLTTVLDPSPVLKWDTETDECWATDGAYHNETWFWYLSVGPDNVGVVASAATSDGHNDDGKRDEQLRFEPKRRQLEAALGPWTDPIGAALLSPAVAKKLTPSTTFRDPAVFQDPASGKWYIIAGVFNYFVAELGTDMISLAETPKYVVVDPNGHDAWGPYGQSTDDKPYLHYFDGKLGDCVLGRGGVERGQRAAMCKRPRAGSPHWRGGLVCATSMFIVDGVRPTVRSGIQLHVFHSVVLGRPRSILSLLGLLLRLQQHHGVWPVLLPRLRH